jgi:hypothetical protein
LAPRPRPSGRRRSERAPIFTSFFRRLVSDHCATASGKASVRMKLARSRTSARRRDGAAERFGADSPPNPPKDGGGSEAPDLC